MTTVRFIELDGTVTDIRFETKWGARYACRVTTNVRAACVIASDEQPSKATGKVAH